MLPFLLKRFVRPSSPLGEIAAWRPVRIEALRRSGDAWRGRVSWRKQEAITEVGSLSWLFGHSLVLVEDERTVDVTERHNWRSSACGFGGDDQIRT